MNFTTKRKRANDEDGPEEEKDGPEEEKEERKQKFHQKDIDSFNKKYHLTKPTQCKQDSRCKGRKNPTFLPHWCSEEHASTTQLADRMVSKIHQLYAKHLGLDFFYHGKCEECADYIQRKSAEADLKKKEKREKGTSVCHYCPETDPAKFKTPSTKQCIACHLKSVDRQRDLRARLREAVEEGMIYCTKCSDAQPSDLFYRRYRHVVHGTIVKCETKICGPCLDNLYEDSKEKLAETRKEKIREKIHAFENNVKTHQGGGCCKNCPLNLVELRKHLRRIIEDSYEADSVFVSILEWDHREPLKKCRQVSHIFNKQDRLEEIAKCDLLCIFCHRLKTYLLGDNIVRDDGTRGRTRVTRKSFMNYLDLKDEWLKKTNGVCPGSGDGKDCQFREDITSEKIGSTFERRTTLTNRQLLLLAFDFDHTDRAKKSGSVFLLGWAEANKCILRCCMCHRMKTTSGKDNTSWVALRTGTDEECRDGMGSGEGLEIEGGELRLDSF